jgi:hypothetical protein
MENFLQKQIVSRSPESAHGLPCRSDNHNPGRLITILIRATLDAIAPKGQPRFQLFGRIFLGKVFCMAKRRLIAYKTLT